MLERLRLKARCIPLCRGPCSCVAGNDSLALVDNDANALKFLTHTPNPTASSACFLLTTCSTSASSMSDENNALSLIMKAQRDAKQCSSKHSFHKKTNDGHEKHNSSLHECHEVDGQGGCIPSREATDMKNTLTTTSKLIFALDDHIGNMKKTYGFSLPEAFQGWMGKQTKQCKLVF